MTQDQIIELAIGGGGTLIGFLAKSLWDGNKTQIKELKEAVAFNSQITATNTLAITKLTVQMDNVGEKLDIVGELRRDVDKMGSSLRSLRNGDSHDT